MLGGGVMLAALWARGAAAEAVPTTPRASTAARAREPILRAGCIIADPFRKPQLC
jgi:hypothetical protein